MKTENKTKSNPNKKNKHKLYKPKKKKSDEENAAIEYLKAQYKNIKPEEIKSFKDFPLSQKTLKGLKDSNYTIPTDIQKQAIGYALQGKDILGAAKTGSGKTLAFMIPILENLFCKKWTRMDGVGALVISPTRELAYQIYETLRRIGRLHDFSAGLIIGGQNLKFEKKRMDQMNILICTPGRLLQHMDENPLFDCSHLQILVLDEADRCLDLGFEATMNAIIENLPLERQTLLFSATQTKSVKDLARLSLSSPTYVAPHEQSASVTPDSLQQSYIVCEIQDKLPVLWSFIKNHLKQKVLVFMATCKQVKYTYDLFAKLRPGISLLALYGTLHQEKRERIYQDFCRKSNVVLFATDLASRGLDFPQVNWVLQYDCPEDVETYIHRAGRTARGVLGKGEGLLILLPQEEKIVEDMRQNKIPINKISVDPTKIRFPQKTIEELLSSHSELKQTAQRAFVNYLKSIYLMKNKEIFDVHMLDTDAYARSLGLIVPPRIKFMMHQKHKSAKEDINNKGDEVIEKLKKQVTENQDSNDSSVESEVEKISLFPEKPKKDKLSTFLPTFNFHIDNDNSQGDNFINIKEKKTATNFTLSSDKSKNTSEFNYNDQNKEKHVNIPQKSFKTKPLTKAAVVKKLLKKKIKVNTTVKFNYEDDPDTDNNKDIKTKLPIQDKNNIERIGIEKLKNLLKDEDKYDMIKFREKIKAKHKTQKRKLKNKNKDEDSEKDDFGSQSESDGPDLSWLPDPNKVYGNKNSSDNEDEIDEKDFDSDNSFLENEQYQRPLKRKVMDNSIHKDSVKSRKIKKVEKVSASLSVQEAEALAMQLLKSK